VVGFEVVDLVREEVLVVEVDDVLLVIEVAENDAVDFVWVVSAGVV